MATVEQGQLPQSKPSCPKYLVMSRGLDDDVCDDARGIILSYEEASHFACNAIEPLIRFRHCVVIGWATCST